MPVHLPGQLEDHQLDTVQWQRSVKSVYICRSPDDINYLIPASAYDFTLDNGAIYNLNSSIGMAPRAVSYNCCIDPHPPCPGELALLLTQTNGGTRISTTRYMQYGSVTARMKTSKWAGVVTAFITMSDVKDEIDWE